MPLSIADLVGLQSPFARAIDPAQGANSLHQAAAGFRGLIGLQNQADAAAAQIKQQQLEEAGRAARAKLAAEADMNLQKLRGSQQATHDAALEAADRLKRAQEAYKGFSEHLLTPGGAARLETQLPMLQAYGISNAGEPNGAGRAFYYTPPGENASSQYLGSVDLSKLSADDKAAAERMFGALKTSTYASTPEQVAEAAASAVQQDPTLAGKEGIAAYESVANPQANRIAARERAAMQATATGTRQQTAQELAERQHAFANAQSIGMRYASNSRVAMLQQQISDARKAAKGMDQPANVLAQNSAFLEDIKAQMGARFSDKDLMFKLNQGSLLDRIKIKMDRWAHGEFPDSFRKDFVDMENIIIAHDMERLSRIADSAADTVRTNPAIRAQAAMGGVDINGLAEGVRGQVLSGTPTGDGGNDGGGDEVDRALEALP